MIWELAEAPDEQMSFPGRIILALTSTLAFFLAVEAAPYALAAFAFAPSSLLSDWAIPPVAALPALLLGLSFTASRGAYLGRGRAAAVAASLVAMDLVVLAYFWG